MTLFINAFFRFKSRGFEATVIQISTAILVGGMIFFIPAKNTEAQARGIVIEPFANRIVSVEFEAKGVALLSGQRAKLQGFVQQIYSFYLGPVHECDIDLLVIEGFRSTQTGDLLVAHDDLFLQRLAYVRDLLSTLGIPERVGLSIKPSESRPTPGGNDNFISIFAKHRVHQAKETIDPAHLECKWPLNPK